MKTKQEYTVYAVTQKYQHIEIELRKIHPPPSEPEKKPLPEPIPDPLEVIKPESDEERVVLKIFKAFRKCGLIPKHQPYPPAPAVRGRYVAATTPLILTLTKEQYEKIGKPGIGCKINLIVSRKSL